MWTVLPGPERSPKSVNASGLLLRDTASRRSFSLYCICTARHAACHTMGGGQGWVRGARRKEPGVAGMACRVSHTAPSCALGGQGDVGWPVCVWRGCSACC